MDFALIEADFQQFYGLELEPMLHGKFIRFCRLLANLPFESRFVQKYLPSKDWDWDKETRAQMLNLLDAIYCHIVNLTKSKGQPLRKVADLFQPDYVKAAKEEAKKRRREEETITPEELAEMKDFWQDYNHKVRENGN